MRAVDIIYNKRAGKVHTREELEFAISSKGNMTIIC